jgi:hypothetical protein
MFIFLSLRVSFVLFWLGHWRKQRWLRHDKIRVRLINYLEALRCRKLESRNGILDSPLQSFTALSCRFFDVTKNGNDLFSVTVTASVQLNKTFCTNAQGF